MTPRARSIIASILLGAALVTPSLGAPGPTVAADPDPARIPARDLRAPDKAWDRPPGPVSTAATDDPTRLIVRFKRTATAAQRRVATTRPGMTRVAEMPSERLTVVEAANPATVAALAADPTVARVSVDHRRYRDIDPTDEQGWSQLWGLDNTGQRLGQPLQPGSEGEPDVDIDGLQAYGVTRGDPSVVVAVIDDGVDFSHPDLVDRAWTNPGESGAGKETNGVDDDGNGYVDDINGWDFCHDDNTVHDFDDDFHGTHVAGTIAASLDGGGVVGVAPDVSIMALKFIGEDADCGFDSQAIAAIDYAKSFGVTIANASWGGRGAIDEAPELYDAIADSGMLFVASAGNDGIDNDNDPLPSLPAAFDLPNILSVAAVDNQGFIAEFSNYGETSVDIAAPGVMILSSLPADSTYPDPGWGWLDGTSMAAPHVSGVAALVVSMTPALADSPTALKARILGSGKVLPYTDGFTATGKTVDALRALDIVPPVGVAPIDVGFVVNTILDRTTATGRVSWPAASDDLTGISGYGALLRVDTASWKTQVGSTTKRSTDRSFTVGRDYTFRVRPRDGAGNWGAYETSPLVTPYLYQETSGHAKWSGKWTSATSSGASGGKTRSAKSANASTTITFTGRAFALVSPKGPTRGKAKLYIDGFYVSTIDLDRSSFKARVLVATKTWSGSAKHTVKLVVVGGGSHPRFDVDAFLVMR